MFAGVPLAFTFGLDAGAVDQQVQRPLRAAVGNGQGHGLLAPAQRAENPAPPSRGRPGARSFQRNRSSAGAPYRRGPSSSGMSGSRHRYIATDGLACRSAAAPRPSLGRTRSSGSHAVSALRCGPASSWSCSSAGWVCSCRPATTLDSRDESLIRPLRNRDRQDWCFRPLAWLCCRNDRLTGRGPAPLK